VLQTLFVDADLVPAPAASVPDLPSGIAAPVSTIDPSRLWERAGKQRVTKTRLR